ncbi:MAG: type II toxin-antitoxin system VapC family toxin [Silvibacterium sp.]|nr:type II toxin-antitoxin system VapC family toxin [Silvibacterium sp.]
MSLIYWDTMLFVYMIEDHPQFAPKVDRILGHMLKRRDVLCTSAFAYAEVLTGPIKENEADLARDTRNYFRGDEVRLIPFTFETAELFAEIRAKHSLPAADSIHLATAAQAKVDLFITNDKRLHKLTLPGIGFIVGLDGTVF